MNTQKFAYALLPLQMADPTITQVTPIIVTDGESGYRLTDWQWAKSNAEETRDHMNERLGLSKEQANQIFDQSFRKPILPRILVTVKRGAVVEVTADGNVEVYVLDHDDLDAGAGFDPEEQFPLTTVTHEELNTTLAANVREPGE